MAASPMQSGEGTVTPLVVIACSWEGEAITTAALLASAGGSASDISGPGTRGPIAGGKAAGAGAGALAAA